MWTVKLADRSFLMGLQFQIFLCVAFSVEVNNQKFNQKLKKMGCTMADRADPTNFKCKESLDSVLPSLVLLFAWLIAVQLFSDLELCLDSLHIISFVGAGINICHKFVTFIC